MIFEEIQDYFEDSIKENIWNGRIELKKILDLLSQKQFCRSTNNKSNAFYVSYFKYYHEQNNGSFNQIIIENKPTIILRTIKKRTEFYVTFDNLPEIMELDFEKQKKSHGIRHWKWLGEPLNDLDFKRLTTYVDYICSQTFKKHVL
tara:strand:- start:276 stop:713 length:438 start_codon:yes stop_codon:yes gene_type:complete